MRYVVSSGRSSVVPRPLPLVVVAAALITALSPPAHANTVKATDTNPDPRIFEVYLTADEQTVTIDGQTVHALVYRDDPPPPFVPAPAGIPGPEIVVNTGDLIIAHLKNELDHENTSIHWHGIEVDNNSDGTGVAMDRVPPGGTHVYRFVVLHPGITWYHPHMLPTHQAHSGMYGPLIVRDPREADLEANGTIPTNASTWMLADINFDASGEVGFLQPAPMGGGQEFHDINHRIETCAESIMMGARNNQLCNVPLGSTVLVNGKKPDLATNTPKIVAKSGEGIRLQLINAAISRYFRLKVTGNPDTNIYRIGGEGGLLENVLLEGGTLGSWDTRYTKGEVLVTNGNRSDVVVVPQGNDGDIVTIVGSSFPKDPVSPPSGNEFDVLYIEIQGSQTPAFQIAEGDPLLGAGGVENLKGLAITDHLIPPPAGVGTMNETITFTSSAMGLAQAPSIDGVVGPFEDSGPDFSAVPNISTTRFAYVGDLLELVIKNNTFAHHPFHLHGVLFQPVRMMDGLGNTLYTWAYDELVDTINIPNGLQLAFRLRYPDRPLICDDPVNPYACTSASFGGGAGRWVYHCHILHHAALGMVAELVTSYENPPPPTHTLSVQKLGFGTGSVTSAPDALLCGDACAAGFPDGTVVTLTAAANPGSFFAGFTGPPDCADGIVTLTGNVTCTAQFGVGDAPVLSSGVVDYLPSPLDLDLDGRGDAVRYDRGLGGATSYLENGAAPVGVAPILASSTTHDWAPGWTIKSGDFNADGRNDLFFYDEIIGSWFKGISTTPQGGPVSYAFHGGTWSPGWSVAILELNGDGMSDVFVYNGATGHWYRGVSTGDGTADFSFVAGQWSPGWQIHPMRLNADGLTDLLLYDAVNGSWFRAINDGAGGFTFSAGTWSPNWTIAPGEFNADALTDLFFYNDTTGAWFVGLNTGSDWSFTDGSFSPSWTVSTGDFNGDGLTDLLLYDSMTGEWYQSYADGAGGWTHVGGTWSPGWVVHVSSFNQDALADVLLYNPNTGAYFQGNATTPGTFVYSGGNWPTGQTLVAASP